MSDLFSTPIARNSDPETSHEAAASVKNVSDIQQKILDIFKSTNGLLHDEEIYATLKRQNVKVSTSGARTRRSELVKMNRLKDSGMRFKLATGRRAILWQLV